MDMQRRKWETMPTRLNSLHRRLIRIAPLVLFFGILEWGWVTAIPLFREAAEYKLIIWGVQQEAYSSIVHTIQWEWLWLLVAWVPVLTSVVLLIVCGVVRVSAWAGIVLLSLHLGVGVYCWLTVNNMLKEQEYDLELRTYQWIKSLEVKKKG